MVRVNLTPSAPHQGAYRGLGRASEAPAQLGFRVDMRELRASIAKADRYILKEIHEALLAASMVAERKAFGNIAAGTHGTGVWKRSLDFGAIGTTKGWVGWRYLPYAGVNEFGGTIARHGTSERSQFKPVNPKGYFVYRALRETRQDQIRIYLAATYTTLRRAGFAVDRTGSLVATSPAAAT